MRAQPNRLVVKFEALFELPKILVVAAQAKNGTQPGRVSTAVPAGMRSPARRLITRRSTCANIGSYLVITEWDYPSSGLPWLDFF